jgi:hypothetical protein
VSLRRSSLVGDSDELCRCQLLLHAGSSSASSNTSKDSFGYRKALLDSMNNHQA